MNKSVLSGAIASIGLLALYVLIMTALSRSRVAAWEQFSSLWWLMLPLAAGFGTQVGLYTRLRLATQRKAKNSLAVGGTSAGLAMLSCCAHHATDVLPILGLSATTTLIGQYQKPILAVSLLINVMGIGLMWQHLRKIV